MSRELDAAATAIGFAVLGIKPPVPKLWIGDNGRLTCGALRCAGMTAHASGMKRDLSGQRMRRVRAADVAEFEAAGFKAKCEGCGAELEQ